MFKAIDIGPYTEDGELSIKLLPVGDVEKTASVLGKHIPDEIALFAKSAKASDDCVWLHIIAMTASDFYGMNRNGDFFYESDLLGMQDQTEADKNIGDYKGKPVQRYKTFLQASFYHHHKNKPDQGHPRFGRVVIAAYNHVMHRVELVVQVFRVKKIIGDITYLPDVDTCNKAINGETIAFSMGCKVPGDFCSITGVWNKGPAEYGPYLKDQMGKILPDGRRVYAINRKPRFFDISKVTIPADPNGLGVTKIANLNIIVSSAQKALDYGMTEDEKVSTIKKSEMSKVIPDGKLIGEVADLHEAPGLEHVDEDLPNEVLDSLGNLSLGKALSNLLASGILASPKEFGTIINIRISRSPNWMKESPEIDWNGGLDTDVQKQLSKHASARSFFGHYPLSRMEKIASLSTDELNKKSEDSLPAKVWQKFNKQLPGGIAIGALLATLYAAYRKNVRSGTVDKFMALVEKNPLALPALIGGTTLGASTLSALVEKKASIHKTVNKMLLATAIPYIGSAYLSEKEHQGKHLNKVQRLIKDHPAAGAITANLLAFGGANAIKNSLTSKVAHLKKCASYDKIDAIENFVVQPMTSLSGSISHSMAGGSIDGYVLNKIFNRKKKNNPSLTEKKNAN
jgi:hypothetical protein